MSDDIARLAVHQIAPGDNDRTEFKQGDIDNLAASMARVGLIQPISVFPLAEVSTLNDTGVRFRLIAGERRWRAACQLKWDYISARVVNAPDEKAAEMMLAENLLRVELNPIDEAVAYKSRLDSGLDASELSAAIGKPVTQIRRMTSLLDLDDKIRHLVRTGQMPVGIGVLMAPLDRNRQHIAFAAWQSKTDGMRHSAMKALCAHLLMEQNQESLLDADDFLQNEDALDDLIESAEAVRKLHSSDLVWLVDDLASIIVHESETQGLSMESLWLWELARPLVDRMTEQRAGALARKQGGARYGRTE